MARKERRAAHRYRPKRNKVFLGWRTQGRFQSVPARMLNLSLHGALVRLDGDGPRPLPGQAMLSPVRDGEGYWVPVEILELHCTEEGACEVKLKLLEALSYEEFKAIVWGKTSQPHPPSIPHSGDSPKVSTAHTLIGALKEARSAEPEPPSQPTWAGIESSATRIATPRELRSELPTLVDSHRKNRGRMDRVQPIPWLTIVIFSGIVVTLVSVAVLQQYGVLDRLGTTLTRLK